MLEYGFNELDNDFVTLWSKKLVSGEDSLIFEDLTKLAELGQINAIQSWYLLAKDNDDNAVVDNIVSNLGNCGANEMLAIAHKNFFKGDILSKINEWNYLYDMGYMGRSDEQDDKLVYCARGIKNSLYGNYFKLATEAYYHNYTSTLNPLMLERFYEMMQGRSLFHKQWIKIDCVASGRTFRKLRKTLLERYEQDKNNVAVAYALGKNLTLFKSRVFQKAMGSQILTELSNRELSKTLQNYQVKGTRRLIKQQIDLNTQAEVERANMSAEDRYVQEVFENVERVKEKYDISFSGNHSVGAIAPEQIGITDRDIKTEEVKNGK